MIHDEEIMRNETIVVVTYYNNSLSFGLKWPTSCRWCFVLPLSFFLKQEVCTKEVMTNKIRIVAGRRIHIIGVPQFCTCMSI